MVLNWEFADFRYWESQLLKLGDICILLQHENGNERCASTSVSDGLAEVLDVFGSDNPSHTSKRLTNRNGGCNQDGVRLSCRALRKLLT